MKQLVNSFVEDVFNGGDIAAADRYLDAAFVDHAPWPGQPGTRDGFKAGLVDFRAAFPDFKVDVERVIAEGDTVVGHYTMSGTHLGAFMGAPPTGKTFRVEAIDIVRLRGGQMVEHWGVFDGAALAQQLGLAP
jgi:steroid delta-isomerase-like uncharacterized protein